MRSGIPARVVERVENLGGDVALVTVAGVAHEPVAADRSEAVDAFDPAAWVVIHMGLSQHPHDPGNQPA
ncbi:MAG: hypothetical protein R6W83_04360 [Cryobacterium sp.]